MPHLTSMGAEVSPKEQKYIHKLVDRFYDACISHSNCKECDYRNKVKSDAIAKVAVDASPWVSASVLGDTDLKIARHIYDAGKACLNSNPAMVIEELVQAREFIKVYYESKEAKNKDERMQEVLNLIASYRTDFGRAKKLDLNVSDSLSSLEKARDAMREEKFGVAMKYAKKSGKELERILKTAEKKPT